MSQDPRSTMLLRLRCGLAALAALAACGPLELDRAAVGGPGTPGSASAPEPLAPARGASARSNEGPVHVAGVSAEGPGCRPGTWTVDVSPDGKAFTFVFSQYQASLSPGSARAGTHCQLKLDLTAGADQSLSVAELFYSGFAFLDRAGMHASQTASYSLDGPTFTSADSRSDLQGPTADEYVYQDEVAPARRKRSRCGKRATLHARTELEIDNDSGASGTGYLNLLAADGTARTAPLRLRVETEPCAAHAVTGL